ncbi:axin-2-like isoform X1 [Paramormyrops kingsleyae]|uniref:axin-2-like isoform X1 n=1 Tax=Paramormyrops kingsleyae TaxID=1676925 RepID=UPI000CD62C65|nr:axin-2-like isoform X1 [Paramormyrops kingsleyae]XP_023666544.1 axin-2-like isoform X1 [Paramormyrops kingsleyae]XP_023666545.1 axin-2-like isoform X1 [Paramormyrops kingsleyae]XP_023666546.1 axin-2-like isoform X1 [Paramormyrops kingsleyae]XP_023666547.1 axin-2-like isoform X1 [Paramormyrops kingsleyae]
MKRALTDHFVSSFREDAPRPPVPGEEGEAPCNSPGKLAGVRPQSKAKAAVIDPPVFAARRDEDGLGEPEGSASPDSPLIRWTKSLHSLLGDQDGAHLFSIFLERENCADTLDFWFACNGFRQMNLKDGKTLRVAKAIYKRYIENNSIVAKQLKSATKVYIRDNIKKGQIDSSMFDQAQTEIQATMEENAYQMFLTSDIFLEYVRAGCESPAHIGHSGLGSLKLMCGYLSRLNVEDEWTGKDFKAVDLASMVGLSTKAPRAAAPLRSADVPRNEYRLRRCPDPTKSCPPNAGCVLAPASSAHDSEASSDALTDDSVSVTDSSVDGAPTYKPGSRKLLKREMHRSVKVNGRVLLPDFPQMQRPPRDMGPVEPAAFAAQLIARLERLKREQDTRSSLEQRLQQIQEEEEGEVPGVALCDEDPQAILDEHLSRVLRSPGCQSPGTGVGVACRCLSPDTRAPCRLSHLTATQQQPGEGADGARCRMGLCSSPIGSGLGSLVAVHCGRQCNATPRRPCQAGEGSAMAPCGCEAVQPPSDTADRSHGVWQWILDSERQGRHRSHGTQRARKPHTGNAALLRNLASGGAGGHSRAAQPSQPFVQDPSMPPLPPPNTLAQLEEARRRLEEASKQRCAAPSPAAERHRPAPIPNGRALLSGPAAQTEEVRDPHPGPEIVVTYFFCGEHIPYRRMVRSPSLTLRHFKEQLRKKGDYRYYFKKASDEFECGAVFEEVWEDAAVLPMYEGKILGKVERMD